MRALQKPAKTKDGPWGTSAFRRQKKKMVPTNKIKNETGDLQWIISAHYFF